MLLSFNSKLISIYYIIWFFFQFFHWCFLKGAYSKPKYVYKTADEVKVWELYISFLRTKKIELMVFEVLFLEVILLSYTASYLQKKWGTCNHHMIVYVSCGLNLFLVTILLFQAN